MSLWLDSRARRIEEVFYMSGEPVSINDNGVVLLRVNRLQKRKGEGSGREKVLSM